MNSNGKLVLSLKRPPPKPPARRPVTIAAQACALIRPLDATVLSLPKVQAPSLQGLTARVVAPSPPTAQELIDRLQDRLRAQAPRRERAVGEAIEAGDDVICDLIAVVNGQVVPGSVRRALRLAMLPSTELPGLAEAMLGMETFSAQTIHLQLPEDYPVAHLAGLPASFYVEARQVFAVKMPELDDIQALQEAGLGSSIEEAMQTLAQEIDVEQGEDLLVRASNAVLEQLARRVQAAIPESAVEEELRRRWESSDGAILAEKDFSSEVQERALQDFLNDSQLRADSLQRIKINLALAALVKQEGLTPSPEQMDQLLRLAADVEPERVKRELSRNPEEAVKVAETALHLAAVEFVMAQAKIEVVD